jgi:hypothetical protein
LHRAARGIDSSGPRPPVTGRVQTPFPLDPTVQNPESLMNLLYAFLHREREITEVFDETLAASDGS